MQYSLTINYDACVTLDTNLRKLVIFTAKVVYIPKNRFVKLHLSTRQTHRKIRLAALRECVSKYIAHIDDNARNFLPLRRWRNVGRSVGRCTGTDAHAHSRSKKRDSWLPLQVSTETRLISRLSTIPLQNTIET